MLMTNLCPNSWGRWPTDFASVDLDAGGEFRGASLVFSSPGRQGDYNQKNAMVEVLKSFELQLIAGAGKTSFQHEEFDCDKGIAAILNTRLQSARQSKLIWNAVNTAKSLILTYGVKQWTIAILYQSQLWGHLILVVDRPGTIASTSFTASPTIGRIPEDGLFRRQRYAKSFLSRVNRVVARSSSDNQYYSLGTWPPKIISVPIETYKEEFPRATLEFENGGQEGTQQQTRGLLHLLDYFERELLKVPTPEEFDLERSTQGVEASLVTLDPFPFIYKIMWYGVKTLEDLVRQYGAKEWFIYVHLEPRHIAGHIEIIFNAQLENTSLASVASGPSTKVTRRRRFVGAFCIFSAESRP